ncbi:MAG: hypothetical protein JXR73_19240 [Candidatus Omnitrophica bacterium]|nr:hypothetical protein [Candidatus Omnitrophota bacterium]
MEKLEKICFVISPDGRDYSAGMNDGDAIFQKIIEPAAVQCGYRIVRSRDISRPGEISPQTIRRIVDDDLLLADLSGSDPIVFYELAIRHMIKKPFIHIMRKGERNLFAKHAIQTLEIQDACGEQMEQSQLELIQRIRILENTPPDKIDSPLFPTFKMQPLEENPFLDQTVIENSMSALSDLREDMVAHWQEEIAPSEKIT